MMQGRLMLMVMVYPQIPLYGPVQIYKQRLTTLIDTNHIGLPPIKNYLLNINIPV